MSNSEKPINKTWQTVFSVGQIAIFLVGIIFLAELSMESQPLLATVASLAWFTSSFLYSKIPDKIGESKRMPSRSFWMGIAEIVLAVSLFTVIDPKTKLAFWGKMFNMIFGAGGFAAFYSAVFFFRFPSLFKAVFPPPPPDPIAGLPNHIQEIINDGRIKVYKTSVISIFAFLGAEILIPFLFFQNSTIILALMGIDCILGCIVVPILRNKTARKWREWALESGIPKDTLKEAALLGGLPWPKYKDE